MKKFLFLALWAGTSLTHAQQHALFQDADLKVGEKLLAENQCNECHIRRVGGGRQRHLQPERSYQFGWRFAWHGGVLQHRAQPRFFSRRHQCRGSYFKQAVL